MKRIILLICLILIATTNNIAQNQQSDLWEKDLDYLVERIEIMHPDPYAFISKEHFCQLKENLKQEIPKLNEAEIVLSISELLATLNDGHTRWALDKTDPQWLQQNLHLLPVIQYAFKDGIYIMAGLQSYQKLVGLKVLQIGKMPIDEVTSKLSVLMSHDNASGKKKYLYYSLCMAEMLKKIGAVESIEEIEMTLQDDQNEITTIQIPTVDLFSMVPFLAASWYPQSGNGLIAMNQASENPTPLWLKESSESFWFEYSTEYKTMFLQINSLNFPHGDGNGGSQFGRLCDQFFEALDQCGAEKLVIDIRHNTGGNHVELPLLEGILARPHLNKKNRLFIITGRVTFSAAVHLTTILKRYTHITHIGEAPSGRPNHFGANRSFTLPNHPQITINCSIDYYQDSEPFNFNIEHSPDIQVEMNSEDYRNNIDPAMQVVKKYERIIGQVDEIKRMMDQASSNHGLSGMKSTYHSNKNNLLKTGYNLEHFLLGLYDNTLQNNSEDQIDFLSFSIDECPSSVDLHFLFARELETNGKLEEARGAYNKCLELNPSHHYAKMRLELLNMQQ